MTIDEELVRLRKENDALRKIVAESSMDCIYCGLSRDDMNRCRSGFPGCARADDMLAEASSLNDLLERNRLLSSIALSAVALKMNLEHGFTPSLYALERDLAAFHRRFGENDGHDEQCT